MRSRHHAALQIQIRAHSAASGHRHFSVERADGVRERAYGCLRDALLPLQPLLSWDPICPRRTGSAPAPNLNRLCSMASP